MYAHLYSPIVRGVKIAIGGGAPAGPALFFQSDFTKGIDPVIGKLWNFSRASQGAHMDHSGFGSELDANIPRIEGARTITVVSPDVNDPLWTDVGDVVSSDVSTVDESIRRITITNSTGSGFFRILNHIPADEFGNISSRIQIRVVSGLSNISFVSMYQGAGAGLGSLTAKLVAENVWYNLSVSTGIQNMGADGNVGLQFAHTGDVVLEVKELQYQAVGWHLSEPPSEFIPLYLPLPEEAVHDTTLARM